MKQISQAAAIVSILLLLIIPHTSAARLLASNQAGDSPGTKPATADDKITLQPEEHDFSTLMGLEKLCSGTGDEDEDYCEKRRMAAEAHLDYIYTQHHHP